jgi:hypothetical protein
VCGVFIYLSILENSLLFVGCFAHFRAKSKHLLFNDHEMLLKQDQLFNEESGLKSLVDMYTGCPKKNGDLEI